MLTEIHTDSRLEHEKTELFIRHFPRDRIQKLLHPRLGFGRTVRKQRTGTLSVRSPSRRDFTHKTGSIRDFTESLRILRLNSSILPLCLLPSLRDSRSHFRHSNSHGSGSSISFLVSIVLCLWSLPGTLVSSLVSPIFTPLSGSTDSFSIG